MDEQFEFFQKYQDRVASIIGRNATNKLVAEGLVSIALGGNDYVNNYFLLPVTLRSLQFSLPAYTNFIISEYEKILAVISFLYSMRFTSGFTFWKFMSITLPCKLTDEFAEILRAGSPQGSGSVLGAFGVYSYGEGNQLPKWRLRSAATASR
jgi:hypothetical protein